MRRVHERGSALLVALGMLVLLSIMGVTFVILSRMEMQAALTSDNMTRARFLAETGLERAKAELRALYAGPVFRPRFSGTPPTANLLFRAEKPYGGTVAAHVSEVWGARAVGLANPATYTSLESMVMPSPVSTESAPYLWSGPQRGRLSDGYFDARASVTPTQVNGVTAQTFRIVRGVVDLNGLVNVNRANWQTLEGLLTYFGVSNPGMVATRIRSSRSDVDEVPQRPFRYVRELVDRGILTVPQLYGEDANGNGVLDSGEDTNGNGALDGALKDAITVFPMTGAATRANSAINVNTAPEPVLFAVFYRVLDADATKALGLARAVIAYRAGPDHIEGAVSEADPDGDGTPNPTDLTGDGSTDDLYCDDNPFDGIFDQFFYPAMVPPGANWLSEFAGPAGEWLDIEGDAVPPGLVSAGSYALHPLDRGVFPNGPAEFSEFEYFMDNANAWFGLNLDTGPDGDVLHVKHNAATRDDVDNSGTLTPTAAFRYDSERWLIISEGRVERGGELQATVTLSAVVAYQ